MTLAFLFPGQGSQTVGMGQTLANAHPAAMALWQSADELLGFSLSDLCWNGTEETLNDTYNTQPALYVAGLAALAALQAAGYSEKPTFVAGHSLGEITALAMAGALSFADGLRLVRERGRLMKLAGERQPGGMAALLALSAEQVSALCAQASQETGEQVQLANDNCPGQVVISGHESALLRAMELATAAKAKKVVRLPVSIAAHSPLMRSVSAEYSDFVAQLQVQLPQVPVLANATAQPLADVPAIRAELTSQLTSPVRWAESVQYLLAQGVTTFIEFGSKDVLKSLVRRIERSANGIVVDAPEHITALLG
jgi:[acyl-carrier-protein] S-malonyltransferase